MHHRRVFCLVISFQPSRLYPDRLPDIYDQLTKTIFCLAKKVGGLGLVRFFGVEMLVALSPYNHTSSTYYLWNCTNPSIGLIPFIAMFHEIETVLWVY
jgi:hypothetical protein